MTSKRVNKCFFLKSSSYLTQKNSNLNTYKQSTVDTSCLEDHSEHFLQLTTTLVIQRINFNLRIVTTLSILKRTRYFFGLIFQKNISGMKRIVNLLNEIKSSHVLNGKVFFPFKLYLDISQCIKYGMFIILLPSRRYDFQLCKRNDNSILQTDS